MVNGGFVLHVQRLCFAKLSQNAGKPPTQRTQLSHLCAGSLLLSSGAVEELKS